MYNTKYICTYNDSDIFLESEKNQLNNDEKEFVMNALYRTDLLNIFNIEEFNEDVFDRIISELYTKLYNNSELSMLMERLAGGFMSIDKEFGLMILYSFDFLYLTHPCVCEFLEKGKISNNNMNTLKNAIIENEIIVKHNITT
jgi:hypothetical protein